MQNPPEPQPGNQSAQEPIEQQRDLDYSPPIRTREIAISARQYLRSLFESLIETTFSNQIDISLPSVHRHIAMVMMTNIDSDHLQDCLELEDDAMRSTGHRYRMAHQLSLIIQCCGDLEGTPGTNHYLADLYGTLGDQVIFLKGMFNPKDLANVVDLNATRLPVRVKHIEDVGEFAYQRASELVWEQEDEPHREQKADTLEFLSNHVPDCIRGLRQVRAEMVLMASDPFQRNILLTFRDHAI